ncbi:hypothetical protein BDV36DRAFT_256287, partial [Aspergillus pseudocaelatus]
MRLTLQQKINTFNTAQCRMQSEYTCSVVNGIESGLYPRVQRQGAPDTFISGGFCSKIFIFGLFIILYPIL